VQRHSGRRQLIPAAGLPFAILSGHGMTGSCGPGGATHLTTIVAAVAMGRSFGILYQCRSCRGRQAQQGRSRGRGRVTSVVGQGTAAQWWSRAGQLGKHSGRSRGVPGSRAGWRATGRAGRAGSGTWAPAHVKHAVAPPRALPMLQRNHTVSRAHAGHLRQPMGATASPGRGTFSIQCRQRLWENRTLALCHLCSKAQRPTRALATARCA